MIWQLLFGLALMLVGGEGLVRGAVAVAMRLRVSPLVIGVTLIGFGTSAPELATCIDAALRGAPGIAIGNVIGSNIANVLLILAIGALLYPIACQPHAFRRDGAALLISALICATVVVAGHAGRWLGAALLLALAGYLIMVALADQQQADNEHQGTGPKDDRDAETSKTRNGLPINLALIAFGLGAVLFGADLLVQGAVELAQRLGVSDTVIGLTVVAVGTSLPELATAVMASIKRQGAIVFGNVIGSNIFNSLGILGATALVQPFAMPPGIAGFDLVIMLGATVVLLLFAISQWRISRFEGAILLTGYVAYIGFHGGAIGA